jgi:excisionase family DNA binding protein
MTCKRNLSEQEGLGMAIATMTPREVARTLGIRLDAVYSLIWAGKLEAEKEDGRWLVDRGAVDAKMRKKTAKRSPIQGEVSAEKSSSLAHDDDSSARHSALREEA